MSEPTKVYVMLGSIYHEQIHHDEDVLIGIYNNETTAARALAGMTTRQTNRFDTIRIESMKVQE